MAEARLPIVDGAYGILTSLALRAALGKLDADDYAAFRSGREAIHHLFGERSARRFTESVVRKKGWLHG